MTEKLCFSVDTHDADGYRISKCVMLHMGKTILEFDSTIELENFAKEILALVPEAREAELERR